FSQVHSLSWYAFGCFVGVIGFVLALAHILEAEEVLDRTSIVMSAAALFLAVRVIVWRVDEGLGVPAFQVRNNAWLGKLQIAWVLNLIAPLLLARFMGERGLVKSIL